MAPILQAAATDLASSCCATPTSHGATARQPNFFGNRVYAGKGAREDAGNALNAVIMSWCDDKTPQVRAHFKGFEILSRGSGQKDGEPELFIRGKETYKANLNPDNPLGTVQSIEHVFAWA